MLDSLFDGYTRSLLIFAGINVISAYSFYLPYKTGQVSLGQAGFMAVGAYASAVMTQKFGMPFAASLVVAGVIAGVVGVAVGFPALRIKGVYLLLLTLGFSEIIGVIALSWGYIGGAQGFPNISFNPFSLDYVTGLVIVLIFFFARLERSSLIAGLAGALFAHQATYLDSSTFGIMVSVEILMFVIVGGGSTYWGPFVGAVVLNAIPEILRSLHDWLELVPVSWTNYYPMNRIYDFLHSFLDFENAKRLIAFGLILIVMMIIKPDGLVTRDSLRHALRPLQFWRWKVRRA
ncbi:MAG: branched-chain amino acid ABC transporter permease [Pseudolabrys sp.]